MARHAHEFQCDGQNPANPPSENCGYFNYPMLSDEMSGNYTIVCGNCGHEHYRVIVNGVVTSDRHSTKLGVAEKIWVMKSATSKERRKLGVIAQFRTLVAAGLAGGGDDQ